MFARILNFHVKADKKEEFVKLIKNQVLPILKNQIGYLEVLPFFPEKMTKEEKACTVSLWATKMDAERYEREAYNKVYDILKPCISGLIEVKNYNLETAICQHFVETLVA